MKFLVWCFVVIFSSPLFAEMAMNHHHHDVSKNRGKIFLMPSDCDEMEIWDPVSAMCLPYPMGMPMTHLMLHGNIFGVGVTQQGPRGHDDVVTTQMLMGNLGTTVSERHFLNVGLMLTGEKWLLSSHGYPLLLQTGEENAQGVPFVDFQHPHSTPIMGLTFSDTIRIGSDEDKDYLKFFFSPRGQSTDGPITFMHRPTGAIQPDAPLGHHLGQDVGHITSTVIGGTIRLGDNQLELSAFNGEEPKPTKVDLPIGSINSGAIRLIHYFDDDLFAMASVAYVSSPHGTEPHLTHTWDDDIDKVWRYSASGYWKQAVAKEWDLYHTLIYGSVSTFGVDTARHSFSYEFLLRHSRSNFFGRFELLQRLPAELFIPTVADQLNPRWVAALTVGYSHVLFDFGAAKLNLGASVTKDFLPSAYTPSYGGNPWTAKAFLELSGMEMWAL